MSHGVRASNIRIGMPAIYSAEPGIQQVTVTDPTKRSIEMPVVNGTAVFEPEYPGMYHFSTDGRTAGVFGVNFIAPEESDTGSLSSGTWGDWLDTETLQREYASLMWLLIAAALAALTAHVYVSGGRI